MVMSNTTGAVAGGSGGSEWSSVRSVSQHEEMNPSCRQSMEDAHVAVDCFGGNKSQGMFSVFDGHGGRGVVDFLADNFEKNLLVELEHDGGRRGIEECLTSSYLITDIQTNQKGLTVSGSTAVTCLVRREDSWDENSKPDPNTAPRVLYCANVGDSRAVLCRGGNAIRLSYDHKASDKSEIKRIEENGGFILRKRVLGILSVSRSFGDHAMKKFVTARPYTTRTLLQSDDEFLILACDGVWDVLSDEEAVAFIREAIAKGTPSESLAEFLVAEALRRNSTDNVTALVVLL